MIGFIQTCDPGQEMKHSRVAQKRVCYSVHVDNWGPQTRGAPISAVLIGIIYDIHVSTTFLPWPDLSPPFSEIACNRDVSNAAMFSPAHMPSQISIYMIQSIAFPQLIPVLVKSQNKLLTILFPLLISTYVKL